MKKKIFALSILLTLIIGTLSLAKETEQPVAETVQVISAEDIGVKTIEKEAPEVITEEVSEPVEKAEEVTEEVVKPKEVVKETPEPNDIEIEEEDLSVPPEGMFEGYVAGEYLPINCYDCDLHDGCYMCDEHTYKEETFLDDEINETGGCCHSVTCIVCGHGTIKPITEEELE